MSNKRQSEEPTIADVLLSIESLKKSVDDSIQSNADRFQRNEKRINIVERESAKRGVIISGIVEAKGEDLIELVLRIGSVLGVNVAESDIDDVFRIGEKKELIKVGFVRTILRRNLVKAVRKRKKLVTSEIGLAGETDIYINEDLGHGAALIWKELRKLKKDKAISHTWVSEGRVFYKLETDDKPTLCTSEEFDKLLALFAPSAPAQTNTTPNLRARPTDKRVKPTK